MSRVYYNDNEPFVCDWLENLIREKLLPAGDVDRRPIQEVTPSDVQGYTQCHFFAGIGGWAYALQLAGWGDRPVWTGSCPCQPFSAAGKGQAEDDPRHLWPHWFRLIRECRPSRVFGEQVANAAGKGWLDVVSTDLEAEAYTVGAVVLGAHSVGAPHIRQRIWFVAEPQGTGGRSDAGAVREGTTEGLRETQGKDERRAFLEAGRALHSGAARVLAHTERDGRGSRGSEREGQRGRSASDSASAHGGLGDATGLGRKSRSGNTRVRDANTGARTATKQQRAPGATGELGHPERRGRESGRERRGKSTTDIIAPSGQSSLGVADAQCGTPERRGHDLAGAPAGAKDEARERQRIWSDPWASCEFIPCTDGKARPVEPGTFPLAHGIPQRVGRLRAYGNAIVPQVAAAFVSAYMDVAL